MIKRLENRLLLTPNDLTPSARGFRALGVFNPGAVRYRNKVILLIRVAEMPEEKRKGTVPYPHLKKLYPLPVECKQKETSPTIKILSSICKRLPHPNLSVIDLTPVTLTLNLQDERKSLSMFSNRKIHLTII